MTGALGLGLALAAGAVLAAETPGRIGANELMVEPTLALAERLLGTPAPEMVEAHLLLRESSALVSFWRRIETTGWSGLCRQDRLVVPLTDLQPITYPRVFQIGSPQRWSYYALTRAEAPTRGGPAQCDALQAAPTSERHLTRISLGGAPVEPDQAAFAYRVFAAAPRAETIDATECGTAFDQRCANARRFFDGMDLRGVNDFTMGHCQRRGEWLCVSGWIAGAEGMVVIEIEARPSENDARQDPVAIGRVRIHTTGYPVV